jgi:hypothetical protein
VQRTDLLTGGTETIWQTPNIGAGHRSFDARYWTLWGTLITAKESWVTAAGVSTSPCEADADFVHVNVIPRTSHEGIQDRRETNGELVV